MLKSEFISKLNSISEEDFEVCVFDWRKNCYHSSLEGTAEGIHLNFSIELVKNDAEETKQSHFIAVSFHNEDYTELGEKAE